MDFQSQHKIYAPENQRVNVTIVGAGSTGSFLTLTLAKMGIQNITVIDYDVIEEKNIPNQFFRLSDVGKPKVVALQEIVKDFTGTSINAKNERITEESELPIDFNTVLIFCVDNMESRQLMYGMLKDWPTMIIDTRFGSEGYSIHVVNLAREEDKAKYEQSLGLSIMPTPCGEKGVIYTILSLASEVCNIVKMIDYDTPTVRVLKREMKTYRFIAGGK